jgi:hypothetical protein
MRDPYEGDSNATDVDGLTGRNTSAGNGVAGHSEDGSGVFGQSTHGNGVRGVTGSPSDSGVFGANTGSGYGVGGHSQNGIGVYGDSDTFEGVRGYSHSGHPGVVGMNNAPGGGEGVHGESEHGEGVRGVSRSRVHGAVVGTNAGGGDGVHGESDGIGVYGKGGQLAGFFEGNVQVTGDISLPPGAGDCAEEFDVAKAPSIEPGTVMVLGDDEALYPCREAYDRRVVGVVSGAGEYRPGLILDKQEGQPGRKPIALLGKAFCKADASYAPIEVGDLLTTSGTAGHAMKISDRIQAFGAVIGKALRALPSGRGLIPILIALQ